MKKNRKKYKIWLIALATPILIYFIWGYFGFAGAWIPGKYDEEKKEYKVLWGLGTTLNFYENGTFRIVFYTPFKNAGLINSNGKVIIPFFYRKVYHPNSKDLIFAINSANKLGAINRKNEIIMPFVYDQPKNNIHYYKKDSIFQLSKNGKYGLYYNNGKEILPSEYLSIYYPNVFTKKPLYFAEKKTESFFVFPDANKVINNKFIIIEYLFLDNETFLIGGILSKDLNPNQKINAGNYYNKSYEKYRKVQINETDMVNHYYGFFDSNGKALLPLEYDFISILKNEKFALVEKDHKMGIYNTYKKDWLVKPIYSNVEILLENLHLFMLQDSENKKYYIDENGTIILSNKANVEYIDENGDYLIFSKNQIRYKLQYNKEKQKFIWHKL